jgi:hypothetical protein
LSAITNEVGKINKIGDAFYRLIKLDPGSIISARKTL